VSEHYFSKKPTTEDRIQEIEENFRGQKYRFMTNAGVFSKGQIDFGTRLLIETMQFEETSDVLDVGCGYGPIGIAAASIASKGRVTLVDINERAVALANLNIEKNKITNARALVSNIYEQIRNQTFDVILSNPPIRAGKHVVHEILEKAYPLLNTGGSLWIVIQKKQGSPSAWSKMETVYDEVEEMAKDKGYRIFCGKKV
jgi:16S rRNA (guanine1207-N2)-methyltransferase